MKKCGKIIFRHSCFALVFILKVTVVYFMHFNFDVTIVATKFKTTAIYTSIIARYCPHQLSHRELNISVFDVHEINQDKSFLNMNQIAIAKKALNVLQFNY